MKASEEFVHRSSPHAEHCATERHGFCDPKPDVVKEASSETGEVEETMEISSEDSIKTEGDTDTQDFGERGETMRSDFIVLRYVKRYKHVMYYLLGVIELGKGMAQPCLEKDLVQIH